MEPLQLALQVEVSLQSEPLGIVLAVAHVPFVEEVTVNTGGGQTTRLLLTEEQAIKLSEDLARRAWDLRRQAGTRDNALGGSNLTS